MADIVIFGAGEVAQVAKAYLDLYARDRVVGFTVDAAYRGSDTFLSLPLVDWERLDERFPPENVRLLGPLSYARMNDLRAERYLEGKRRGYEFASFVHPGSHVHAARIGENSFILENNVIQPFVDIGVGALVWSGNHIGHHASVGDFCFLASHIAIGGGTSLGERCFVAGQVGIESRLTIGRASFIGSGAIVKQDLADESVVPGPHDRPARYSSARLKRLKFR